MSSPDRQVDDVRSRIHDALYRSLIDKIRSDQYPSVTMMDAVEAGMNEEQLADYADVLLTKIEADRFPSIDLMRRLISLAQ